jgi:hypothetical protein
MSSVSEWITREYFESLGFMVRQPRKFQVASRPKLAEEEIDLLVFNPLARDHRISEDMIWSSDDVRHIRRAIVAVRGWHSERFSPAVLEQTPELFRLSEDYVLQKAEEMLGEGPVAKILCIADLPATKELRDNALKILKEKGIDGVLLFPLMLLDLAAYVDPNKNYEKSDLLQMLRILKAYNLLRDAQLELFKAGRPKKQSAGKKAAESPPPA